MILIKIDITKFIKKVTLKLITILKPASTAAKVIELKER